MAFKKKCYECKKPLGGPLDYIETIVGAVRGKGSKDMRKRVEVCNKCVLGEAEKKAHPLPIPTNKI